MVSHSLFATNSITELLLISLLSILHVTPAVAFPVDFFVKSVIMR